MASNMSCSSSKISRSFQRPSTKVTVVHASQSRVVKEFRKNVNKALLTSIPALLTAGIAKADQVQGSSLDFSALSLEGLKYPDVSAATSAVSSVATSAGTDLSELFSDPTVLIGAAALIGIPLIGAIVVKLTGSGGPSLKVSPTEKVLKALDEIPSAVLLDIRTAAEVKQQGVPSLKQKKKYLALPFLKV